MERSLTAAAKVRRRLKAGRPAKIRNDLLTVMQALNKLVNEADKARNLMREEGLNPDDVGCALIYCTPEKPGSEDEPRYQWLPEPERMVDYFSFFDTEAKTAALLFLGILWRQQDRDAEGEGRNVVWVTQFMGGPKAEEMLFAARDKFIGRLPDR